MTAGESRPSSLFLLLVNSTLSLREEAQALPARQPEGGKPRQVDR